MQKKRTASLPIFNRGKRPRQALLTHPNNVDGGSSLEQQQQQENGHWNTQCYGQAQHQDKPRYSSYANSQPKSMPKNSYMPPPSFGRTASYNQSQPNKENVHNTTNFRSFHHHRDHGNTRPPRPNDIRGQGFTPHKAGDAKIVEPPAPRTIPNTVRSTSPADTGPPGRAVEPTEHHAAKLEPFPSSRSSVQLPSHFPRVLTATAKGMEHWSKYKMQIPMLFEIFGTLNSSVMAGPLKSKEFSLQTRDGVVRCLYWEMDRPLPHLVRGRHLRVVGVWEESSQWVKCHCVREASQQEVQYTHQLVALADSAMREAVLRLSEI